MPAPPPGLVVGETHWFQLGVLCAASFVVWAGFGAILPYLPVFLQEQGHAPVRLIALTATFHYIGALLFAAPLGRLSDRIGRKPMIVGGVALYAVATFLFVTTTHVAWFLFFRLLEGVGAAAISPAGQALVAELTAESKRSRAYGWLASSQFAGLVGGPVIAWLLWEAAGGHGKWAYYSIFLFGSALSAITAVLLAIFVREPEQVRRRRPQKTEQPRYRSLLTRPVLAFIVVAATSQFAMGIFEALWSLFLHDRGASVRFVGLTWVAFSVPMLFSWAAGLLADRYNRWVLMFSGYAISSFAWISYGIVHNLTLFIIINVIEGLAIAWAYPAKQSFLVQVVPLGGLGSVQGLEQSFMQASALVGTLVASLLYQRISGYVISLAGVVSLAGLLFSGPILLREWNRQKKCCTESRVDGSREV